MKRITIVLLMLTVNFAMAQNLRVLTYNIRMNTPADGENAWPKRSNQVSALLDFHKIEIFGLLLKPISANITIVFKPEIFDQKFDLNLIELKIGNLSLPPVIGEKLINYFFGGMLNQVGDLKIANINLKERQIKIFISGGKIPELVNNLIKPKPEKNY